MPRKCRFDSWLLHCDRRLQYIFRSLKAGCRTSYRFGEFLYQKVRQGASFVIYIVNKTTGGTVGLVCDDGRVCQCA